MLGSGAPWGFGGGKSPCPRTRPRGRGRRVLRDVTLRSGCFRTRPLPHSRPRVPSGGVPASTPPCRWLLAVPSVWHRLGWVARGGWKGDFSPPGAGGRAGASWKVTCRPGPADTSVSGGGFLLAVSSPGLLSFWGRRNRDYISGGWPCVAPVTQGRGCPQPEPHGAAGDGVSRWGFALLRGSGGVSRVAEPHAELWQPPPPTSPPHTRFGKGPVGTGPAYESASGPS